jgi:hypothetical protein
VKYWALFFLFTIGCATSQQGRRVFTPDPKIPTEVQAQLAQAIHLMTPEKASQEVVIELFNGIQKTQADSLWKLHQYNREGPLLVRGWARYFLLSHHSQEFWQVIVTQGVPGDGLWQVEVLHIKPEPKREEPPYDSVEFLSTP